MVNSKLRLDNLVMIVYIKFANDLIYFLPSHDCLYKVRKLLNLLSPLFLSEYNPREELSIDEAMIPLKGCLSINRIMGHKSICIS